MLLRLPVPLTLVVLTVGIVQASLDCLPSYKWSYNRQNISPCDVASSLLNECNSAAGPLLPLNDSSGDAYYDPLHASKVTLCMCNTISYSLVSACGICQGQSYLYWDTWVTACNNATVDVWLYQYPLPLPPGLDVPAWAYMDVTTIGYFSINAAFENATSNATQTNTQTLSTPTAAPPSSSLSPQSTNGTIISNSNVTYNMTPPSQADSSGKSSNASHVDIPTLIGAITGAVSGLVIVVLAILRYMAFRKVQKAKKEADDEEKRTLVDTESVAEKRERRRPKHNGETDSLNSEIDLEIDAHGDANFSLHA